MSIRAGCRIPSKGLLINLDTKEILNFSDHLNLNIGGIYDYSPQRKCGSLDFPSDDEIKGYNMVCYNGKLDKFATMTRKYIYFWDLSTIREKVPYQRCKRPSSPCVNFGYLDNECVIVLEDESYKDIYTLYTYKTNFVGQKLESVPSGLESVPSGLELITKIEIECDNIVTDGNQIIVGDEHSSFYSIFEFDEKQRLMSSNVIQVEQPDQLITNICTSKFQVFLSNFQIQIRCKIDNSFIRTNNIVGSASSIIHFNSFNHDNIDFIIIANDYGFDDQSHFEDIDEFWDNYTPLNIYRIDLSNKEIIQIDKEVDYWENNDQFRAARQIVHYPAHDFLILQRDVIEIWNLFPMFKLWSSDQMFDKWEKIAINNKLEATGITNGVQQTTIFLAPCIFANLIASGLFELNEEGIFASFLQKDLYDPRLLLLIWAFVYEPRFASGDYQTNETFSNADSLDEDED
jgi:hypothetical protein